MEITGVGVLRLSTSSTVKPMPALHFTIIKETYVPSFIAILACTYHEVRNSNFVSWHPADANTV